MNYRSMLSDHVKQELAKWNSDNDPSGFKIVSKHYILVIIAIVMGTDHIESHIIFTLVSIRVSLAAMIDDSRVRGA